MALTNLKGSMSVRKAPQRAGAYSFTPQSSGIQMPAGQAGPIQLGGQAVPAGSRIGGGGSGMAAPIQPLASMQSGAVPGGVVPLGGNRLQERFATPAVQTDTGPTGTGSRFGSGSSMPNTSPEGSRQQMGIPGEGAPPPEESDESTDMDEYWQQLLGDDASDWEKKQQALRGEMAGYGREADLINSRMGHSSISGGYASVAGAALGKGMEAYSDAELAHNERRRQMQLEYLQYQLEERRRQEERGWQQEDQAHVDWIHLIDLIASGEMPPGMDPAEFSELAASDPDAAIEMLADAESQVGAAKAGSVSTPDGGETYTYTDADGNNIPLSSAQWNDAQNQLEQRLGSEWTGQANGPTTAITALLNAGWRPGDVISLEQAQAVAEALAAGNFSYNNPYGPEDVTAGF